MLVLLASWCGAEYGGRVISPSPGSRAPASECSAVSSSDSSGVRSGSIDGIRSARLVLPAPLGPVSRIAWPPAAATSAAYLASPMPRRSARSTSSSRSWPRQLSSRDPDIAATGGASGTCSPRSSATTCASDRIPITVMPGTIAASAHLRLGHEHVPDAAVGAPPAPSAAPPAPSAARRQGELADERRAGRAPRRARCRRRPGPRTAMARSKCGAALGEVGRGEQHGDPLGGRPAEPAVEDRHPAPVGGLAQRRVGRPTMSEPAWPGETSACTSIRWPSAPCSDTVRAVATGISRSPGRARPRPDRGAAACTATRSTRVSLGSDAVRGCPPLPEPLQPVELGVGDRLVRRAAAAAAAGLDLADHQHLALAQHQVDLAVVAAPVAVEHDHPLLDEVARGHLLAVGAQRLLGVGRTSSSGRRGRGCRVMPPGWAAARTSGRGRGGLWRTAGRSRLWTVRG